MDPPPPTAAPTATEPDSETDARVPLLETTQARHRKEARDLQSCVTSKKKNATKKTRRGVLAECEALEAALRARQAGELAAVLGGGGGDDEEVGDVEEEEKEEEEEEEEGKDVEDAAEKLRALKVGTQLGAKRPQQQQQQQQREGGQGAGATGAGKKRNRQKERLARRAADVEAAAAAAEAEAATQTDHRGRERAALAAAFAAHGRVEHEIRPDGHCLFSAVADQLVTQLGLALDEEGAAGRRGGEGQEEPGYQVVRRRAAEYVGAHADAFAGFLEEGVEAYVVRMRDTAEWGGQVELAAVASVWDVEVAVVQDSGVEVVKPAGHCEGQGAGEAEARRVWLAYYRHGYGLGEHYNSLRKA